MVSTNQFVIIKFHIYLKKPVPETILNFNKRIFRFHNVVSTTYICVFPTATLKHRVEY